MSSILFIIIAILMLGLLILVHETGHYITGRLLGFKINEFAIGLGPKIFSKEIKGIVYSLRLIPMGGFVAFHGEDEEEEKDPRAMNNMPWYKRAVVMFAGAGFNLLFAFLVTVIMTCAVGYYAPSINEVFPESDLYGVAQQGDIIRSVNGKEIVVPARLQMELDKIPFDEDVNLTLLRNGEKIDVTVKRYYDEESGRYLVGYRPQYVNVDPNIFQSTAYAFKHNVYMVQYTYEALFGLITGRVGIENVTGPISTIGQIGATVEESAVGEAASMLTSGEKVIQTLLTVLQLLVILSINLAVMNLIPFPALDGFRLFSALIEGITRKHIPRKIEGIVNFAGLIILVGLMVVLEITRLRGN